MKNIFPYKQIPKFESCLKTKTKNKIKQSKTKTQAKNSENLCRV